MKDRTEQLEDRYACYSDRVSLFFPSFNDSSRGLSLTEKVDYRGSV